MDAYKTYMKSHEVDSKNPEDPPSTHLGIKPSGSWYIEEEDAIGGVFYKLYAAALDTGMHLSVCERACTNSTGPLLVDLDFKLDNCERGPSQDEVINFVNKYFEVASLWLVLGKGEQAWVMTREGSDGVHIMVPQVACMWYVQQGIREMMLQHMPDIFAFEAKDWGIVYDKAVVRQSSCQWLLYGGKKASDLTTYRPKYIITSEGEYMPPTEMTTLQYVKLFSIANKYFVAEHLIPEPVKEERKAPGTSKTSSRASKDLEAEDMEALMGMLSVSRADDYKTWLDVGFALGNTYAHDELEGLKYFIMFSKKSVKYSEDAACGKWVGQCTQEHRGPGEPLTLGSIKFWAQHDSPDAYAEYSRSMYEARMQCAKGASELEAAICDGTDTTIRSWMTAVVGDDMACVDKKALLCYMYEQDSGMWKECEGVHDLMNTIQPLLQPCVDDALNAVDKEEDGARYDGIKRLSYFINMAKKFADPVKCVAAKKYDVEFANIINTRPGLLAVKNGIIELRTGTIRELVREDYVTSEKVIDIEYVPGAKSQLWDDTLHKIFCGSKADQLYMQVILGYALTAEGVESTMPFIVGDGAEGKSFLMNIFCKVANAHVAVMNIGTVCNLPVGEVSATNNLGEELSKMMSHRVLLYNEIQHCSFNANFLKLTGNDAIPARGIFKKACTISTPRFPIGVTNQMPSLPKSMGPNSNITHFKRRIRLLRLWASFVEAGTDMVQYMLDNPDRKEYYRQDPELEKTIIKDHLPAVLTWLVEGAMKWYEVGSIGAVEPESVRMATAEYFESVKPVDMLQQFIDSGCKVGDGLRVTTSAFFTEYSAFRRRVQLAVVTTHELNRFMASKKLPKVDSVYFKREELELWGEACNKPSRTTSGFLGITLLV